MVNAGVGAASNFLAGSTLLEILHNKQTLGVLRDDLKVPLAL
jgi:hypothetical protein